ncbi:sensor histidine kinase [Microbulbifer variabilis]|uniref:sensor histidine kinase n=1 Tax=Microbulbifer variabilis TaxID=266805 RepID=UPI001CFC96A2|nr:HAMP domain-containing sensor histidine kinase [Microbulbifer variabilis]
MRETSKLQRKVFAILGGFTLLLCLVFFAICMMVAYVVEDHLLDNLLAGEVRHLEQQAQWPDSIPEPRLPYLTLYTKDQIIPPELRTALPDHTEKAEWFSDSEFHFHLRRVHFSDNSSAVLVAEVSELLTVTRQSSQLLWLFASACALTLLLALYCAYRISHKTIAPVVTLAKAVKQQINTDSEISLPYNNEQDEIGYLASTLQETINQLKQTLRRETEFTRDTSHELRTGLTILKGTLTLSQNREMTKLEKTELLETVTSMEETVKTLLALARSESLKPENIPLRAFLEERLLVQHQALAQKHFKVDLKLGYKERALANRLLVTLLFDNLISNALQHASSPELVIAYKGDTLCFENATDNQLDLETALLPGQKKDGSDGIGQGLFLAKRICEALNWTISVQYRKNIYQCALSLTQ